MNSMVHEAISKLKKLNCRLLVNSSDIFIYEILFQPGPERVKLIEWILTKLEFFEAVSDTSEQLEDKIETLYFFFSYLGMCTDIDVIKGLSSQREQILFWQALVDTLWGKYSMGLLSSHNAEASEDEAYHSCGSGSAMKNLSLEDITETQFACMSQIIQSGFMKEIKEPQLFPKDLLQECELLPEEVFHKHQIPTLEEGIKQYKNLEDRLEKFSLEEKNKYLTRLNEGKPFPFQEYEFDLFLPREEVKSLHEKTNNALNDVHACATGGFSDAYTTLKPLTSHVEFKNFFDSGPAFESAVPHVDSVLKFEKSLQTVKSSDRKVNETLEKVAGLKPSTKLLSNLFLKDSIEIMKS